MADCPRALLLYPWCKKLLCGDSLPSLLPTSEVGRTVDIAEAVQARLDSYKADKRDLGSVRSTDIVVQT